LDKDERIDSYIKAAELGDKVAGAALGWEFLRGDAPDLSRALRQFELLKGIDRNFALFNIAKAKYIFGDQSFHADLEEAVKAEYVPALYLKAASNYAQQREVSVALWLRAARAGHLPSTIQWLGKKRQGILRRMWDFPLLAFTMIKFAIIHSRNPYDERVLS